MLPAASGLVLTSVLALALAVPLSASAAAKPHIVALGAMRREPYSLQGDPAGAQKSETELKVLRWSWTAR